MQPMAASPAYLTSAMCAGSLCGDLSPSDKSSSLNLRSDPSSGGEASVRKSEWKYWEDVILLNAFNRFGTDWEKIQSLLPGRSEDATRNRIHGLRAEGIACMSEAFTILPH